MLLIAYSTECQIPIRMAALPQREAFAAVWVSIQDRTRPTMPQIF